jgi:intracellular sulfur oxidation DsrE/DsrF family protein
MKIKLFVFLFFILSGTMINLKSQEYLEKNKLYTGAEAPKNIYKAIYQMDQSSPAIIKKTIRNINNLLEDSRLHGKIQVELVAYSGGTDAYLKNGNFEKDLKDLIAKGVVVTQCLNTLSERKIDKNELFDFLSYVPSGNGEIVIKATEGWIVIKP